MTILTGLIKDPFDNPINGVLTVTLIEPKIDIENDQIILPFSKSFYITEGVVNVELTESETSNSNYLFKFKAEGLDADIEPFPFYGIIPNTTTVDLIELVPIRKFSRDLNEAAVKVARLLSKNEELSSDIYNIYPFGEYDDSTSYRRGSIVTFDNADYIAIKATSGGNNPLDPEYWYNLNIGSFTIPDGSISKVKLEVGVKDSLDLADTALQSEDIGLTVQGHSAILDNTTASYTTEDKSKLDGIQAGAEVNNINNVNATELTSGGDTTLHTHDGRYYTETETNNLLSGKEPTINSGTTSQYWRGDKSWQTLDKNAVGLGNVDDTSDANKPVSSATQTALNLKLNKSGDTISSVDGTGFLGYPSQSVNPSTPSSGFRLFADSSNRLSWRGQNGLIRTFDGTANTADRAYILPNESGTIALNNDGQIINGVARFIRTTAPATRVNGSALVAGDQWYNPSTGRWAFWRSPYWLSTELNSISLIEQTFVTATSTTTRLFTLPTNAYLDGLYLSFNRPGATSGDSGTNYMTASFACFYGGSDEGGADRLIDSSLVATPYYDSRVLVNQKFELAWNNAVFSQNVVNYANNAGGLGFSVSTTETGTSDIRISAALFWRWRL